MATKNLREHIDSLIERYGGLNATARALDIDKGFLCHVRKGTKTPGPRTLRKMGLERRIIYVEKGDNHDVGEHSRHHGQLRPCD